MRQFFIAIFVIFALSFMPSKVSANEMPPALEKLVQGVAEILKSPAEIINQPKQELEATDNKLAGFLKGLAKAPFALLERLGKGATDVVTFPVASEEEVDEGGTALEQAKAAFTEVFKSPLELINTPKEEFNTEDNKFLGSLKGILKAPFEFIEKLGNSLSDVIGAPASGE